MPTASGRPGPAQRELAAIDVDLIPDRPGQLLRQALQERLGERRAVLRIAMTCRASRFRGEGIGIQPDTIATRGSA